MKPVILLIVLVSSFLFVGCFISDNLIENFRTINASLEKSNTLIISKNEGTLAMIHQLDRSIYLRADTVHILDMDACNYVDAVKKVMLKFDPKGDNINIPSELLVNTIQGLTLQHKLADFYNFAHRIVPDSVKEISKEMLRYELRATSNDTAWTRKIFRSIPTIAAVSSLSRTENDCLKLEARALVHLKSITISKSQK